MNSKLWQSYQAGNITARDRLLEEHLGLVHHVARQMSRTLAVRADFDELVSAGTMGLMSALDGFDPSRGLAFSTFAAPRIRGAILDELRKQDHVPRSIRRKTREILAAREALMRVSGHAPDDKKVAEHLGVDVATLWRWQADIEGAHHIPLDRAPGERESHAPSPVEVLHSDEEGDVEDQLTHEQEVRYLKEAIAPRRSASCVSSSSRFGSRSRDCAKCTPADQGWPELRGARCRRDSGGRGRGRDGGGACCFIGGSVHPARHRQQRADNRRRNGFDGAGAFDCR
jgi:RNA polymerase sigma factor for flagellar operon FliA